MGIKNDSCTSQLLSLGAAGNATIWRPHRSKWERIDNNSDRGVLYGGMSSLLKVLVVLATYNERENLRPLLERILSLPLGCDVLVVDDNSPDGTGQEAEAVAAKTPQVHVLHRPAKLGLGPTLIAGFNWAMEHRYERIINIDGDLSHDPGDIPRLVARSENADLVIGSRYAGGIRVVNWRRDVAPSLAPGYSIVEEPIIFTDRRNGTTKMSPQIVVEATWRTWQLCLEHRFRRRPRRLEGVHATEPGKMK